MSRERLDTPLSGRGVRERYVKETTPDTRRLGDTKQVGEEEDLGRRHYHHQTHQQQEWRSTSEPSRRHQKLQRSFDRGDSGIENDYRKDSFNDRDLRSKWKQRTYDDDRRACDAFLRKERRHTAENHPVQYTRKGGYGFRERSIDDGSHFDPRLDRYSDDPHHQGTLRRNREKSAERYAAAEKKKSGLEKVNASGSRALFYFSNAPSYDCPLEGEAAVDGWLFEEEQVIGRSDVHLLPVREQWHPQVG